MSPVPVHVDSFAAKSMVAQSVFQSRAAVIQSTLNQVSSAMGSPTAPEVTFKPIYLPNGDDSPIGGAYVVSAGSAGTFEFIRNLDATVTITHYTSSGAFE
jgi:hypothetical protein